MLEEYWAARKPWKRLNHPLSAQFEGVNDGNTDGAPEPGELRTPPTSSFEAVTARLLCASNTSLHIRAAKCAGVRSTETPFAPQQYDLSSSPISCSRRSKDSHTIRNISASLTLDEPRLSIFRTPRRWRPRGQGRSSVTWSPSRLACHVPA